MPYGRIHNKKRETEIKIYEAGLNLFREKGFTNTTIQDISEKAGVSKSTVFNYYSSKADILLKFGRNQVAKLKVFAQKLPEQMNSKSKILKVLLKDAEGVEESREIARISLIESYKCSRVYIMEAENRVELASIYEKILCEGQIRGEIDSNLDCKHIAGLIVAIYFHALYTAMEFDNNINLKEYLTKSIELLWSGISK